MQDFGMDGLDRRIAEAERDKELLGELVTTLKREKEILGRLAQRGPSSYLKETAQAVPAVGNGVVTPEAPAPASPVREELRKLFANQK